MKKLLYVLLALLMISALTVTAMAEYTVAPETAAPEAGTSEAETSEVETPEADTSEADTSEDGADVNFRVDFSTLSTTLPIMGMGMLGIFLVTCVIILAVVVLGKLGGRDEES